MKIETLDCLPLRDDGTILAKIVMYRMDDNYRYSFYVYKGVERVHTQPYGEKSFLLYRAERLGTYKIKAFVRNRDGSERDSFALLYTLTKKNAPRIAHPETPEETKGLTVSARRTGDCAAAAAAGGMFSDEARYAWYIYRDGETEPIFKGTYDDGPEIDYSFSQPGRYWFKVFVKEKGERFVQRSEPIEV